MRFAVLLLCLTSICGCAVRTLHKDQNQIRAALLDLYTDQIMDNIVRATNGMPIIQLDYANANGTVTYKQSASLGEDQTVGQVINAARTVTSVIRASISGDRTNQVALTASPVITSNEVYDAYLQFIAIPGSVVVTCEPPPPCAAHITKQCGDKYYWIPVEYRGDFFKLALLTTAQRGKSFNRLDEFFTATVKDFSETPNPDDPKSTIVTLVFDKKIPNDSGYLVFEEPLQSTEEQLPVPNAAPASPKPVGSQFTKYVFDKFFDDRQGFEPSMTDKLVIFIPSNQLGSLRKLPKTVRVFEHHNRPQPPSTDDLLERANFQLQQIQFNQLRGTGI